MKSLDRFRIVVTLACLTLLTPAARAVEPFIETSLVFKYRSYREGETNEQVRATEKTVSATCISGANCWRIQSDASVNGENLWFYDGTNVYERLRLIKPLPADMLEKMEKTRGPAPAPFDPTHIASPKSGSSERRSGRSLVSRCSSDRRKNCFAIPHSLPVCVSRRA
jgi:hypothetical protein